MNQQAVYEGLQSLVEGGRIHPDIMLEKLKAMQEVYLQLSSDLYSQEDIASIRYYLRAVSYKFQLASLSLDQLWSLSDHSRLGLAEALENSLDNLDVSEDELLIIAYSFESFLFYGQSFLDFYMLYVCLVLGTGHQGSMSRSRFYKRLRMDLNPALKSKARKIERYFDQTVYGRSAQGQLSSDSWGSLLTSLRDKITHRDKLRPSFESSEKLADDVLFNWPTIQEETYDRFCQRFQNGMFYLIQDCSEILYGLEWKSGPLRDGMWD